MSTPHPSSPPKPNPKITLHPVHALDFPLLATLETQTFYPEPFSSVAFGPTRDSAENMALRAEGLTKNYLEGSEEMGGRVGEKRRWWSFVKAVCGEEIVGWAGWSFNFVGEGEGEGEVGEKEEKEEGGEGRLVGIVKMRLSGG
ncbi:hypothetical protein G7Y89_g4517 [Cudoniella acicularis]|uniref:Uncharacterized protein n=1 Tax=Cudoniella acicularis TaxID=354080 RepID=A0A8H4RQQ5_9HELO|nr:hypothetical protein G7Y89_g4517 [Cudoniella acicularis]